MPLKFYQKIYFWVIFFVLILVFISLFKEVLVCPGLFKGYCGHISLRSLWSSFITDLPGFILLLPIGIYGVFNYWFRHIHLSIISYVVSIGIWLFSFAGIFLFRKRIFFKIISIIIVSWFIGNALGFMWLIWLQLFSIAT